MTRAFALGGDGVVLDLPREGDIDALYAACTTPLVHETLNVPWPYERPHAEGFIREYAPTVWASGVGEVFAVRESADGPMLARWNCAAPPRRWATSASTSSSRPAAGAS